MHRIYNYIPETNHFSGVYSVATVLYLQGMLHVMLFSVLNAMYFYISTSRIMCAVPNMAVFSSNSVSFFPGMLLGYFLNDFEMVPVAPIVTGITFDLTFHSLHLSIARSLYLKIFSTSFLFMFLSPRNCSIY